MDDSITIADKKRDYMQFLDNVLVIGGEDKATRSEMCVAQSELLKYKGANAALYGDLGYIIMIATAGECVTVYALNLCKLPNFSHWLGSLRWVRSLDLLCVSSKQIQKGDEVNVKHHHHCLHWFVCGVDEKSVRPAEGVAALRQPH